MFILKPHSGVPIYRQLSEQIRRLVASGQLRPGTALPSIRELALRHAINPMTVSKVYSLLESEGLLERHRGKPMTVAARPNDCESVPARVESLEAPLDNLILAARQLELGLDAVIAALKSRWEQSDG